MVWNIGRKGELTDLQESHHCILSKEVNDFNCVVSEPALEYHEIVDNTESNLEGLNKVHQRAISPLPKAGPRPPQFAPCWADGTYEGSYNAIFAFTKVDRGSSLSGQAHDDCCRGQHDAYCGRCENSPSSGGCDRNVCWRHGWRRARHDVWQPDLSCRDILQAIVYIHRFTDVLQPGQYHDTTRKNSQIPSWQFESCCLVTHIAMIMLINRPFSRCILYFCMETIKTETTRCSRAEGPASRHRPDEREGPLLGSIRLIVGRKRAVPGRVAHRWSPLGLSDVSQCYAVSCWNMVLNNGHGCFGECPC